MSCMRKTKQETGGNIVLFVNWCSIPDDLEEKGRPSKVHPTSETGGLAVILQWREAPSPSRTNPTFVIWLLKFPKETITLGSSIAEKYQAWVSCVEKRCKGKKPSSSSSLGFTTKETHIEHLRPNEWRWKSLKVTLNSKLGTQWLNHHLLWLAWRSTGIPWSLLFLKRIP